MMAPPAYQDSTQILFLGSPDQPGERARINPYLQLASTLVSTADVIRLKVTAAEITEQLADQGATADYDVTLDQSTPAPVLIVTTEDSDPAVARRTSSAVVEQVRRILQDVQQTAGAPRSTWVSSTVISQLPKPRHLLNHSLRPAIGAGVVVLALALFGLFWFEGRHRPAGPPTVPAPAPVHLPSSAGPPAPPLRPAVGPRRTLAPQPVMLPTDAEGRPIWQP